MYVKRKYAKARVHGSRRENLFSDIFLGQVGSMDHGPLLYYTSIVCEVQLCLVIF